MKFCRLFTFIALAYGSAASAADPVVLNLWPGKAAGETKELPPEGDQTKASDKLIAGRRIIKLGNVSTPQLTVYRAPKDKDTGVSVIIAPGGGHNILAYDLEGTEVAEWLNGIGITGIVLKYRVPGRDPADKSRAALQDGQRAVSLVRFKAAEWGLDPKRIGMLGFSAGGQVAGMVSTLGEKRLYDAADDIDRVSSVPDFAVLIYPGLLADQAGTRLLEAVKVTDKTPPMFFVHAFDDGVPANNSLLMAMELKKAGVKAEVHVYSVGGHGYGMRHVDKQPVTDWPKACEAWLKASEIVK